MINGVRLQGCKVQGHENRGESQKFDRKNAERDGISRSAFCIEADQNPNRGRDGGNSSFG